MQMSLFQANFPTIMEYLPYCKSHWTAERDYLRHPWMCSQGYVIMWVVMRGTGNSTGLYFDEYAKQEQDDACEIIGSVFLILHHNDILN